MRLRGATVTLSRLLRTHQIVNPKFELLSPPNYADHLLANYPTHFRQNISNAHIPCIIRFRAGGGTPAESTVQRCLEREDPGRGRLAKELGIGRNTMEVAPAVLGFIAVRGIRVPGNVSLICTDPHRNYEWCEPSIAHITWDISQVVRSVTHWATNVTRGKEDQRQIHIPTDPPHSPALGAVSGAAR